MRDEYDFRSMRGAVRGKYAERYRAKEPTVRIFHEDGTIEEGPLAAMRKKFDLSELPPDANDNFRNVTFVSVPNELVPQVQELIARTNKT
jgi:hypothetical protein